MATFGKGVVLQFSTDGGTTKTSVAEVTDITLPEITYDAVEITAHSDPDVFQRFQAGAGSVGDVKFTINVKNADTGHTALTTLALAGTTAKWYVQPPSPFTKVYQFDGFVKSFAQSSPIDDMVTADITIQVSGKPIYDVISGGE